MNLTVGDKKYQRSAEVGKGLWRPSTPTTLLTARPGRPSCSHLYPVEFGLFPRMEMLPPSQNNPFQCSTILTVFSCLNRTSVISVWSPCLVFLSLGLGTTEIIMSLSVSLSSVIQRTARPNCVVRTLSFISAVHIFKLSIVSTKAKKNFLSGSQDSYLIL